MRVRADEDIVAQPHRVRSARPQQGMLHDHAACADLDATVFGGQHRPEQHARLRAHAHVATQHRRRRDVRGRIDGRPEAAMFDEHHMAMRTATSYFATAVRRPGVSSAGMPLSISSPRR